MVDAADLKSATRNGVWVRLPPSAPSPPRFTGRGVSFISHVVIFWLLHPFNPFRVSTMKYKFRLYLHYHGLDDDLELVLVVLGLILFCLHCPYRNNYWSLNLLISDMTDHHLN